MTEEEGELTERDLEVRVLVCGSRGWTDRRLISTVLGGILQNAIMDFCTLVVIEGCCPTGADFYAHHFLDGPCVTPSGGTHASHPSVKHEHYPALWGTHGKAAGPIRNQQMLDEGRPNFVLAFHDDLVHSKGTKDMVNRAKEAGLIVYLLSHA